MSQPCRQPITGHHGAFCMQGLHKAAVYKDKDGKLHMCSAVCTHMGAQVRGTVGALDLHFPCMQRLLHFAVYKAEATLAVMCLCCSVAVSLFQLAKALLITPFAKHFAGPARWKCIGSLGSAASGAMDAAMAVCRVCEIGRIRWHGVFETPSPASRTPTLLAMLLQVEWNNNEKTFDCPNHGSHFDRYGRCIQGPASTDLKPL